MIDLQAVRLEKLCSLCGCKCETEDEYCPACGENLKVRAGAYR